MICPWGREELHVESGFPRRLFEVFLFLVCVLYGRDVANTCNGFSSTVHDIHLFTWRVLSFVFSYLSPSSWPRKRRETVTSTLVSADKKGEDFQKEFWRCFFRNGRSITQGRVGKEDRGGFLRIVRTNVSSRRLPLIFTLGYKRRPRESRSRLRVVGYYEDEMETPREIRRKKGRGVNT